MVKPRLIILIRHAQSEGNKNREIHQSIPDHRVKLTQDGWSQAHEAGRRLRSLLRPDDTLHFFTSPYRRTRETTEGILTTLTSDEEEPSPFRRDNIKVYEEPRLREQDFGNFQPCSAEMERMWQERADYGHFFYRIPNGESAADAYDRVSGFNESLWRQFGEDDFASVCVLVTHGLMSRVFLMKWYHFTVEYFEDLRNVNHCEFLIMRRQENSKYLLENKLRTWSELRRERERAAAANKDKTNGDSKGSASPAKMERNKSIVVSARRWGGCPNGCDHGSHYKRREDLEIMRQQDMENTNMGFGTEGIKPTPTPSATIASRRQHQRGASSDEDDSEDPRANGARTNIASLDVKRIAEEIVSSPDGTPSFISPEDRLRILKYSPHHHSLRAGRDFGGTYSGRTSQAGSDSEMSEDERRRRGSDSQPEIVVRKEVEVKVGQVEEEDDRVRKHALANRLGDAGSDHGDDGDQEDADLEDIDRAEAEDRSIRGSVY
ncbi:histidine phosphatase superfamily (branch 1) domain-containing protein [Sarocladium implicatum]|nr:histidine phosphatase superfamily (branch 1) domain-containing protein [Sarocladium implicatum]